ncbi:MAG: 50S ribosomal protein L35ae [Promethearchaeota archaeon]
MTKLVKNSTGYITSYRRSKTRIHPTQILVKIDGFDDKSAASKLIGHDVEWISETGTRIRGTITRFHGGNGVVRVHLHDKGVPGQAIGGKITIVN